MGKGGGGGTTQSTGTTYQTNIPEYARPYVETMLGATQKQLFEGTPTEGGGYDITGFKPYQAYSQNPADYVAGFSPMQQQAQRTVAGMQVPGTYGAAADVTGQGIMGALGTAGQADVYGRMGAQAGMQGQMAGMQGQDIGMGGLGYGSMAARSGMQGQRAGMQGQQAGLQGMGYGAQGYQAGVRGEQIGAEQGLGYGNLGAQAGLGYGQQVTSPSAVQSYMSPYMQNVVDVQQQEAIRQSNIQRMADQAQAVKAGAFGGSRQALVEAERQRNLGTQLGAIQAQGSQNAYQQAIQNMQQASQLGMQGAGVGLQGAQTALQGTAQRMQGAQAGMQGAGMGIQGAQAAMQGAGMGIQGAQAGMQGINTALQGTAQGMQGAGMGIQGAQAGLQGLGAQQAAYNQAMQGAQQYANLGGQALQAQQNIANLQSQYGAQQQSLEQQKINQAIQDWANQQQYPLMQLGVMSNMLRGLPMQASTTNQYVAAPNPITQGIGLAGAGASLYNAMKAEGGVIKSMASGGITSVPRYDVGGEVASQLEDMPVEQLQREAQTSSSPTVRAMAKRILAQKQMERAEAAKGTGPMGIQYQAADGMAAGGILAFTQGGDEGKRVAPDVYGDPDVKAWSQGLVGATQSGDQKAIDFYRGKMENAVTNAQAREAVTRDAEARAERSAQGAINMQNYVPRDRYEPSLYDLATPAPRIESPAPTLAEAPVERRVRAAPKEELPVGAPPIANEAPTLNVEKPGILQAAPAKAAPAPAKAAPAPAATKAAPAPADTVDADIAKAIAEGKRPLSEFVAEQKAEYEKAGVDLDNKAAQEQRAKIMSERANTADEAKRQQWMRAAEFFGRWGSTPGPTLAAGLSALQKSIPDMITDKKEQKKVERELDKMAYDIDQAVRLEKKGLVDEATKKKEKAADRGMHLQQTLMTSQATRYSAEKHLEGTKITAAAHKEGAAAQRENTAAYREGQLEAKKQDQYRNAMTNQTNVLAEIAREKQGKTYLQLEQDAKIPATAKGTAAERRAKAIMELERIDKDHDERIQEAKSTVKYFAGRAGIEQAPAKETPAQSVTVGGKTYNRPAGFTDAQWEAYKKSQGVK